MLENILRPEDCAICKICCKFELDELFDAPTFTEEEMRYAVSIKPNMHFTRRNNIYQIVLEPWKKKYICPLLSANGCVLLDARPFDCKSWPFYLMRNEHKYILALSPDCPIVWNKSLATIKSCIDEKFLNECRIIIRYFPDMITDYNRNLEIIYVFDNVE